MFAVARSFLAGVRREMHFMAGQRRSISAEASATAQGPPVEEQDTAEQQNNENVIDMDEIRRRYELEPVGYTVNDFKHLIKNEADEKQIHVVLLELVTLLDTTGRAPNVIDDKQMARLMEARSRQSRERLFYYFFKTEMSRINDRIEKEKKRIERESRPRIPNMDWAGIYAFTRNKQMQLFYNYRMAAAAIFGQKLVIDCAFEDSMSRKELDSLLQQIQVVCTLNKLSRDPFDLILSDIQKNGFVDEEISRYLPHTKTNHSLITKSYESYLEMFPNDRIIYLSPNSNRILRTWDPEAVIILGGIVDKSRVLPLTLGKAKQQRIEHYKLPIGEYIPHFRIGSSQSFAIHIVADILLTLKATNDWNQALKRLPRRFTSRFEKSQDCIQEEPQKPWMWIQEACQNVH